MYDGDEYEDQLLGDPNQLDDLIEARNLSPLQDEQQEEEENETEEQDQDKGDDSSKKTKTKRRVVLNPQPKLDAVRLTGPRGIATIEERFRDFKFLGRGYEEQDLKRIMERLELWGNRLFPKYQFDDFLEKVEKLGQKRPVMNFVNKIRLGMVNEDSVAEGPADEIIDVEMDLDDDLAKETANPSDDLFTQLIDQQLSQLESQKQQEKATRAPKTTITEEQRQRMLHNRQLAEERRLARLKAQQEKDSVSSMMGASSQADVPTGQSMINKPSENSHETHPASPNGKAEERSLDEDTDGNVDIIDAVVSTIKVQDPENMEVNGKAEESGVNEDTDASVDINDAVVSVPKEQDPENMEISLAKVEEVD